MNDSIVHKNPTPASRQKLFRMPTPQQGFVLPPQTESHKKVKNPLREIREFLPRMGMLRLVTLLFGLFLGECAMAGLLSPKVKTLSNGLQVIVVQNGVAPIAEVRVVYKVGTADDPQEVYGISHFLEHLMFMGSRHFPDRQYTRKVLEKGGQTNAHTSWDATVYETEIAAEFLELIFDLEADRMDGLSFTEEQVKSERDVVVEERKMRMDNHPFGLAFEVYLRTVNMYHPYGIPPIGYPHHIQNYSFQSARKHYETWYVPNNAAVIVCGRVDPDEVFALAEKYFGRIASRPVPERKRPLEANIPQTTRHIVQKNERNSLILLGRDYPAFHHRDSDQKLFYAMFLVEGLLGGNETTEFYRYFVEDKHLALGVSGHTDAYSLDPRTFHISASLSPDQDKALFKSELDTYLARLIKNGVTSEEFARVKKDILAEFAFMRDGNGGIADFLCHIAEGFTLEELDALHDRLSNVTLDEVNEVIRRLFMNPPFASMDLLPCVEREIPEGVA